MYPVVHYGRPRGSQACRCRTQDVSVSSRAGGGLVNTVDTGRATLGALLLLPLPECQTLLNAVRDDDPDDPRLRVLLSLVRQVVKDDRVPDPAALLAHAQSTGTLKRGELTALALLLTELVAVEACPIPAAAGWYAAGLVETSVRRRVLEAAERLRDAADRSSLEGLVEVVHAELVDIVAALERLTAPIALGGAA